MPIKEDASHVFFFGRETVFSQFYPCQFVEGNKRFSSAEQYMHYQKAILFGNNQIGEMILATDSPVRHKELGRQVINFDERVWSDHCKEIVKKGNLLKVIQNEDLLHRLLVTFPKQLVEANPFDRLWGIGLFIGSPNLHDPKKWRGQNMLGKILTDVRDEIANELQVVKSHTCHKRETSALVVAGIVGGVLVLCLVFFIVALVCKAANAKRNRTRHHVNTRDISVVSQQQYNNHYRNRAAGPMNMIPAQPPQPPPYTIGAPPGDRVFSPPPAYPGTPAPPGTNTHRTNAANKSRGASCTSIGSADKPNSPPPAYYE